MFGFLLYLCILDKAPKLASAGEDVSEVPFRISYGSLDVQVGIGGRHLWFALDSGGWINTIDRSVAKRIRDITALPGSRRKPAGDRIARVATLSIGSVRLNNQAFLESDFGANDSLAGDHPDQIAGVLGFNALRFLSLGIDFGRRRLFIWGPNHQTGALPTFFGSNSKYRTLCHLKVGPEGLPMCQVKFGGIESKAVLDIGSFVSSISKQLANRIRQQVTTGDQLQFDRGGYTEAYRTALLQRISLGSQEWRDAPITIGNSARDSGSVVGWSALSPFGRVLFDFDGGSVLTQEHHTSFNFLDSLLGIYGARIDRDNLVIDGTRNIPLKSIKSMFGVTVDSQPKMNHLFSTSTSLSRRTSLRKVFDESNAMVRYVEAGRANGCILRRSEVRKVNMGTRPIDTDSLNLFEVPGYYLVWNGHVNLLPAGELLVPNHDARVVSVGGLPRLPLPIERGDMLQLTIPRVRERLTDLWKDLGWEEIKGPVAIRADGSRAAVVLNRSGRVNGTYPPPGAAVAMGAWRFVFDEKTGAIRVTP